MKDFSNFQPMCQILVANYHNQNTKSNETIRSEDVYVVWYTKTLQNAKALLSTPVSDGMYYEVTYNGDKSEFYFDAYSKTDNVVHKLGDDSQ